MKSPRWTTLLAAAVVASTVAGGAQSSAPGGINLSGTWALDTYLSDHPAQVDAAIRMDLGQMAGAAEPSAGPTEEGRRGRGDSPPRGQGGGARGGDRGSRPDQARLDEQNQLSDQMAALRYPATTLTIAQTATAVTFTDEKGRSRTLTASGKREKQTLDTTTVEVTTKWEGPVLVSEQDLGKGRKVTFTYSIVPTTKQLLVRVALERAPGQPGPFEVKQVYGREGAR